MVAIYTLPAGLLLIWGAVMVLSRHLAELRAGHQSMVEHSITEATAEYLHKQVSTAHVRIASTFYQMVIRALSWFVPRFRSWTIGFEKRLLKVINDVRGKRLITKRDKSTTSVFL